MDIVINPKCGTCKSYYKQTMIKSSGLPYKSCETCINRYYKNKKNATKIKPIEPIEATEIKPIEATEIKPIDAMEIKPIDKKLEEMIKHMMYR